MNTRGSRVGKMMKRQLILEKALELFAERGFEATSVQQITERCGISKGAFYLSFKSKDELILEMIDFFMSQLISDIDQVVREVEHENERLYKFYYTAFHSFYKRSDFTKIFMKEQLHSFNKELIMKIHNYDQLMEDIILSMVERLYGEEIELIKFDLVYIIKGFLKTYSEFFIFYPYPLDLDLLAKSLVEKTNLLARQTTVPFISQEIIQLLKRPINEVESKDEILGMLAQKIEEMEESVEKESLILLKQQVLEETYSYAIVKGLLGNIQQHPHCKWISYVLRNYFEREGDMR
jgi:AcrR family transcriptional regulator